MTHINILILTVRVVERLNPLRTVEINVLLDEGCDIVKIEIICMYIGVYEKYIN